MEFIDNVELVTRMITSIILCGLIGFEREYKSRPAGFRTHIMVGLGATLIMIVSIQFVNVVPNADGSRIASQVVSGIGFLGAGTIITRNGAIDGLTTASSLWLCAGIGLAIGMGFYEAGILAGVVAFITLTISSKISKHYGVKGQYIIDTTISKEFSNIGEMASLLKRNNLLIHDMVILDDEGEFRNIRFKVEKTSIVRKEALKDDIISSGLVTYVDIQEENIKSS